MTDVFIERQLPEALTTEGMAAIAASFGQCLAIHRVTWRGSLLSADGRELFCHFVAPDAESVRLAMRQAGAPPGRAWACRVQDAPGTADADLADTTAIVLHAFPEPASFGARELQERVDTGCFHAHRVRLLRSYLSVDGQRLVALYRAPDAESVRIAQRGAGLPPDRVVAVRRFAPS